VILRLHHGSLHLAESSYGADWIQARFTPDGQSFITSGGDAVRVWETATGKPRYPPLRHEAVCPSTSLSSDGRLLVTASWDNWTRVWDLASGQLAAEPLPHPDWVLSACFSPEGRHVLTACRDGMARLWDWQAGRLICPPLKHVHICETAAFTADGRWLITTASPAEKADTEAKGRIWDWHTAKPVTPTIPLTTHRASVAVTPDGKFALFAGLAPAVHAYSLADLYEPGDLSLDDLCLSAELLSGHRIQESDVAGLTAEEWLDRWQRFRKSHPGYFALGEDHPNILVSVANLGVNYLDAGRLNEAITLRSATDFAGVRGPKALASLAEAGRQDWQQLWSDVEELRAEAGGKSSRQEK
jgi:WD40 repeat protein